MSLIHRKPVSEKPLQVLEEWFLKHLDDGALSRLPHEDARISVRTLRSLIYTIRVERERIDAALNTTERKDERDERIAKSLAALNQPSRIKLTREEWIQIAENADAEDQSSDAALTKEKPE